jgi:2-methylcitrate dehydratase PrpD
MNDPTNLLSQLACDISLKKMTAPVQEQVRWVVADTLASIVAGSAEPEMQSITTKMSHSTGTCSVIGTHHKADAQTSAFLNGTSGTFLEMDEGNRFSKGHPAIHVLPAVWAICSERKLGADAFLSGLLAGYEIGSRIGASCQLRSSMHPHGTWGTVGAAVGVARAMSCDVKEMREVINISTSLTTATSKKTMLQGGLVRNTYAGISNRHGLLAFDLMRSGFTGETDGIASVFGEVVSTQLDTELLVKNRGADWQIMHNYFKMHSCCRYNHGTLDAIDHLATRATLPHFALIEKIEVQTYLYAAELDDLQPRNTLAAKFSVPFAVATRLVNGNSAISSFTWDALNNADVMNLAKKVSVTEDPAMTKLLPQERPAHVKMYFKDGSVLETSAGVNRGDDASPYTRAELKQKFEQLCGRVWSPQKTNKALDAVMQLSSDSDLNQLLDLG